MDFICFLENSDMFVVRSPDHRNSFIVRHWLQFIHMKIQEGLGTPWVFIGCYVRPRKSLRGNL